MRGREPTGQFAMFVLRQLEKRTRANPGMHWSQVLTLVVEAQLGSMARHLPLVRRKEGAQAKQPWLKMAS